MGIMARIIGFLIMPLVLLLLLTEQTFSQVFSDTETIVIGQKVDRSIYEQNGPRVYWKWSYPQNNENPTSYIRLHFSNIQDFSERDYQVVVYDQDGVPQLAYDRSTFSRSSDIYTVPIAPGRVTVAVEADSGSPDGLSFVLQELVQPRPQLDPQSAVPIWEDLTHSYKDNSLYKIGKSVAKIHLWEGTCTGFLVSENLLVTNHHCLAASSAYALDPAKQACQDILAEFGYESASNEPREVFRCRTVRLAPTSIDLAILELEKNENDQNAGTRWGTLTISKTKSPSQVEEVIALHYPRGTTKKISPCCWLFNESQIKLGHNCSTFQGSSGAPLVSKSFPHKVIGLHMEGSYDPKKTHADTEAEFLKSLRLQNLAVPGSVLWDQVNSILK